MADYKPWYRRYRQMFEEECEEMRKRDFILDRPSFAQQRVIFTGYSSVEQGLLLTVEYPDSFPSKPPRVSTAANWKVLPRHHNPNTRELCTYGTNQHRWNAGLFGTSAIDEADSVIRDMGGTSSVEAHSEPLIDDVPEPVTLSYAYQTITSILVPYKIFEASTQMSAGDSARFKVLFRSWPGSTIGRMQPGRGVVTELNLGKTRIGAEQFFQNSVSGGVDINGIVYRLASSPPNITSASDLNTWLQTLGIERRDWMAFIFTEQAGTSTTERTTWIFFRSKSDKAVEPIRTFVMDGDASNARIPKLEKLSQKKVVLIGCGSVGSKIGAALAATGVESFGLVDYDFMEPDNSVRHELGVESFGIPKPNALSRRIIELNPKAWNKVEISDLLIGQINQAHKESQLHNMLSSASLVIDSTGDHGASRFINDICAELGVPQIYASVTNGAWAGEFLRVIPRKSACWLCWLWQYENSKPPGEPAPGAGVFAPGCDHPTFTGTTYDVGMVANLAASLAVDTLLIDDVERKHFDGDYIRWQLKNPDGDLAPKIEVLPITKRTDCKLCEAK